MKRQLAFDEDEKESSAPKSKPKESSSSFVGKTPSDGYGGDDDDDDDDDDDEDGEDKDYDEEGEDELPWYKQLTKTHWAMIVGGAVLVIIIIIFIATRKEELPPPPAPTPTPTATIDPIAQQKERLAQLGIGKSIITSGNVFEQGNIEENKFRKDFLNNDMPESYVEPIKNVATVDSVTYIKHRTVTDDGIDMYWIQGTYKGKKCEFTIPYYIYRTLSPEGVMDVYVETVEDATGNIVVTSFTAVPPSGTK